MRGKQGGFKGLYLLAIIYVIIVYAASIGTCFAISYFGADKFNPPVWIFFVPVIVGLINHLIIKSNWDHIRREDLLYCSVLIKYLSIPLYIVGSVLILIFALLIFTPIVFMIFVSPFAIGLISTLGWLYMLGGAPFAFAYLKKSKEEKVHGAFFCKIGKICQVFFVADLISMMLLALKEKKCIKLTIATVFVLVVGWISFCIFVITKLL